MSLHSTDITSLKKIFTVSEINFQIKSFIEPNFRNITLQGEISNFKHQSSGHLYFSLKDDFSQISAVLFKGNAKNLLRLPKSGDKVIVKGEISVYSPRGNYQIIIRDLKFEGTGELLLKLHKLKEELKQRGWFDTSIKKKIPAIPKKIGVVTSPTGAVIQDILNVLNRRFSGFHLILNPVKVQGENAKEEIAQAIYDFNKYNLVDVIIVGRGGGSLEDLWAFNEEIVAKAIFESKIPIISAVGHETDTSISDFVADYRAPTPSAAAEIAIKEKSHLQDRINYYNNQIIKIIYYKINEAKASISSLKRQPLFNSSYTLLGTYIQKLDDISLHLNNYIKRNLDKKKDLLLSIKKQTHHLNPLISIQLLKQKLNYITQKLDSTIKNRINLIKEKFNLYSFYRELDDSVLRSIKEKKERLVMLYQHLKSIDPKNLLKKGYSILFSENRDSIILSTKLLKKNQKISAQLYDGEIFATIDEINNHDR